MADLPTELTYGKVVGRLILAVADSADTGRLPDATPAVGSVTFTPLNPFIKTQSPAPATVIKQSIVCNLDSSGFLIDPASAIGVWLVAGVYSVKYTIPLASVPGHDITVLETHDDDAPLDLTNAMPPGGPILSASQFADLSARLDVVEGSGSGSGSGATLEEMQDNLGNTSLLAGTSLTKVYDDAANTITLNVDAADFATGAEGDLAATALQTVAVPGDITATGTASASTFLRGDGAWAAVA